MEPNTEQNIEPNIEQNNKPKVEKESGLGVASFVLGIIAICTSFIIIINNMSFIMGIIGAIFGIIGAVKSTKKGKAIAGIILCVLAVIFTLAYQTALVNSLNDLSNELNDIQNDLSTDLKNINGDNTDELMNKVVDVEIGKFVGKVDKYGFTDTELTVIVTNKTNEQKSFSVQIEAVDANGVRLDTDTIYITNLNPGQSVKEKAFNFVTSDLVSALNKAEFKVVSISMY